MKNNPLTPRLGIIGGAGPMADALLFQKIVQICQTITAAAKMPIFRTSVQNVS